MVRKYEEEGRHLVEIEVRGTGYPAKVVPLPFYKREKPKSATS